MENLTGKILIASPELLTDHFFSQSVILVTQHNSKGSMGFILNKPEIFNLKDFFKGLPHGYQLWNGGPVEKEHLLYIHKHGDIIEDSILIDKSNNLFIGGDFSQIKKMIAETDKIQQIKFFLGYSGWGEGQLEQEIKEKAWGVLNNDLDIFHLDPKNLWKEKLIQLNPHNIIWKNAPINPHLN